MVELVHRKALLGNLVHTLYAYGRARVCVRVACTGRETESELLAANQCWPNLALL